MGIQTNLEEMYKVSILRAHISKQDEGIPQAKEWRENCTSAQNREMQEKSGVMIDQGRRVSGWCLVLATGASRKAQCQGKVTKF